LIAQAVKASLNTNIGTPGRKSMNLIGFKSSNHFPY